MSLKYTSTKPGAVSCNQTMNTSNCSLEANKDCICDRVVFIYKLLPGIKISSKTVTLKRIAQGIQPT